MQLDDELKELIRARLASFDVMRADPGAHRRAAVAVPVVEEGTGAQYKGVASPSSWSPAAALLLTRRPLTLRNHAGQWALPGGRIEDGETAEGAALRELREEVGLGLASDDVLGRLDDYATRSGFVITPIVVWAGRADALVANPEEVASIHRIPVQEFMREDAPLLDPGDDPARPVMRMPVGDGWIAAPTAAILYQFRELCIAGRATRVAHFDQPRFAWR
jgi:8-oxo-dGTP pyrophosphatase MutT (NUDIX family)